MAQNQNPRRFYIDHGDNQPVVRAVPVRRPTYDQADTESAASAPTHQVVPPGPERELTGSLATKARRTPQRVTRIVRSARSRSDAPRS